MTPSLARPLTFGSSSISARKRDPFAETADEVLIYPFAQPLDVRRVDENLGAVLLNQGDAFCRASEDIMGSERGPTYLG